ncbi:unnamed protein product [Caenorhabditis brenneri]
MTNDSRVNVTCTNSEIWKRYEQFPEIIVKKQRRRPLPGFQFQVTGLDPMANYSMSIRLWAQDKFKYNYGIVMEKGVQKNMWHRISDYEHEQSLQQVDHHWGVQTGKLWMKEGVEFLKLFVCTEPDEYSFVAELGRVYCASLVIVNNGTDKEIEVQMDILKLVTVSSYRKGYKKPEEQQKRPYASPPKSRGLKRPQNEKSLVAVKESSQVIKQKVNVVPTPSVNHQQFDDFASGAENIYVMPQPVQNRDSQVNFDPEDYYEIDPQEFGHGLEMFEDEIRDILGDL